MARTIRRQRHRANINEPIPDQYDVLFNISDQYRTTSTGEVFLQYDLQINDQRLLIVGSAEGVNFLSEAPHWFVDGTFETAQPQFANHGLNNGRNVVCLFALLMDKSESRYDNLFNHVRILTKNANPVSINMDYERAAINSANNTFPGAEISCCFFHSSQNIYKRDLYRNDDLFRT